MVNCMLIAVAAALVNNVVLSQLLVCRKKQIQRQEWEQRLSLLL